MKRYDKPEIKELNISSTANQPTRELKADDVITGVGLKQGVADGSGPEYPIPYYPNN